MFDKFHEECAVMGVYGHPEAANMVYLGLYALQHRGQESCGIVSSDGRGLISHRQMGLLGVAIARAAIDPIVNSSPSASSRSNCRPSTGNPGSRFRTSRKAR